MIINLSGHASNSNHGSDRVVMDCVELYCVLGVKVCAGGMRMRWNMVVWGLHCLDERM